MGGTLIIVGRNLQRIKEHEKDISGLDDDVVGLYKGIREVGKEITDTINSKHSSVRKSLDDINKRLGRVEGKVDMLNGKS